MVVQEATEVEEPEEELQECSDHRPSSFENSNYANLLINHDGYIVALSYTSCLQPLMHQILLSYHSFLYLVLFSIVLELMLSYA